MTLIQVFFIISGIIISFLGFDIAKKQKFNALHFLVFISIGGGLVIFTFFPKVLKKVGDIFGLAKGADVLVYTSVIFLLYFVLLLLRKVEKNKEDLTKLVREIAINNSDKNIVKGKEVFIIPAYNEGKVIKNTINLILKAGYKNIIIINDGSNDNTLKELLSFGKKILILTHYKNRGQGASLETGFEYIRRYGKIEYVITFDSDGQHDINDVQNFEEYLIKHPKVDILLGSRFINKKNNGIPFTRRIILKLGIIFTYFLSNINLSDTHNGFRVIKKSILGKIIITIDGMGHASEIIDIIASNKLTYKEVPVNIKYTEYSLNKGQKSSNAINIALKMIWNKFFK